MELDLQAEKTLTLTLVSNPAAWDYVAGVLKPEMLGHELSRRILSAVQALVASRQPVTAVTVQAEMAKAGVGGSVVPGWAKGPTARLDEVPALALRIRELWARREIQAATSAVAAKGTEISAADATAQLGEVLARVQAGAPSGGRTLNDSVYEWLQNLDVEAKSGRTVYSFETGFRKLDQVTGGLRAGTLAVFAARPGIGKSSFAVAIAVNLAARGIPVGVFWLEDDRADFVRRALSRRFLADSQKLRGKPGEAIEYAMSIIGTHGIDLPIVIDDTHGLDANDLCARMRRMAREHGIRFFIADHLGEIRLTREERWGDRHDLALGRAARMYRDTAKELSAVPLMCVQMNRNVEHRESGVPRNSDLDNSGQIEQAARLIAFLDRKDDEKGSPSDKAVLYLTKNSTGPTGLIDLAWDARSMTFENPRVM